MGEVMIPPWVRPESPETIRWIDDATSSFAPAFGRGMTQRGIWADPRWGLRRRYRGLRSDEKAAILNALNETRGQLNILRVTPHAPLRGSFATSELLTNNTFASGTAGWSSISSNNALSVSDRVFRMTRSVGDSNGSYVKQTSNVTAVQYAPYAARAFMPSARNQGGTQFNCYIMDNGSAITASLSSSSVAGMRTATAVLSTTAANLQFGDGTAPGAFAGDYILTSYTSLARCALVDNGPNALLRSDAFDNAAWTKTNSSVVLTVVVDPYGNGSTAFAFVDTGSNAVHQVSQDVATSSAAADYAICGFAKANVRNFCFLAMDEGATTTAAAWFNVSTGVVGSTSVGAGWSNVRSVIVPMGNGWYYCALVARKTSSATTITARIGAANVDASTSYAGSSNTAIYIFRAALSPGIAMRASQTTTATTSGASQTGGALYTKGWPASTNGLLLTGDWVEVNGELKQLTAPVNSDAAGLAYMQFRPGLAGSPADSDPVIVFEPFGRFIYPGGTREFENMFGIYGDCEMNLEEIYS